MKRITALLCTFLLCTAFVSAQESSDKDKDSTDDLTVQMNMAGDQYIKIAISAAFPIKPEYPQLYVGGSGTIGYHRFLNNWFAVGFDVNFGYAPTLGSNIFTYIPFLLSATVQPTLGRFEFPMTLAFGGAIETYISRTYFPGLVVKPELGVFYRATESWSFGIEGDYMWMPQWYVSSDYQKYNYDGMFWDITLCGRYHF